MLISIIVPVYNVEEYLCTCVSSLIQQTYKNIEIILVDDGSPDNCPTLCDEFALQDNRIKVIHKENGGLSSARNVGLKAAEGEYVLFVDSDDVLATNACHDFSVFIDEDAAVDILIGLLVNSDGTLYSRKSNAKKGKAYGGEEYYNKFNNSIIPCAVASLYRRNFLIENNLTFLEGRYHEDSDFTPRAYIAAKSIIYTENEFYIRFVREDSITQHKDKRKNLKDFLAIARGLVEFSDGISNEQTRWNIKNGVCISYLSLFYIVNIYQYTDENWNEYIDKKLVLSCAKSKKNKIKALVFAISPKIYILINKTIKIHIA